MKNSKSNYKVIGSCPSGQNKNFVISKNDNEDIIIAQNFSIFDENENKTRTFYEKGSMIIKNEYKKDFVELLKKIIENI